jgi:hypothetical protein
MHGVSPLSNDWKVKVAMADCSRDLIKFNQLYPEQTTQHVVFPKPAQSLDALAEETITQPDPKIISLLEARARLAESANTHKKSMSERAVVFFGKNLEAVAYNKRYARIADGQELVPSLVGDNLKHALYSRPAELANIVNDSFSAIIYQLVQLPNGKKKAFKMEFRAETDRNKEFAGGFLVMQHKNYCRIRRKLATLYSSGLNVANFINSKEMTRGTAETFVGKLLGAAVADSEFFKESYTCRLDFSGIKRMDQSVRDYIVKGVTFVNEISDRYKVMLPSWQFEFGKCTPAGCIYWPGEKKADAKIKSFLPVPVYIKT